MAERGWHPQVRQMHEHCKQEVKPEQIYGIENAADPFSAAKIVLMYDSEMACAILDSMSPLGAAFVLLIFETMFKDDERARLIVGRAKFLEIRGSNGLAQARDEMFRMTGVPLP